MPAKKIQDEAEAIRLLEDEGYTYEQMIKFYRDKYNIETAPNTWSTFRRRRGLKRRIVRDPVLIPWKVKLEHRHDRDIIMLRREAKRRAGDEISAEDLHELEVWKRNYSPDGDVVLHYDPDTKKGWIPMRRRPGVDLDLIREPDKGHRTGKGVADGWG